MKRSWNSCRQYGKNGAAGNSWLQAEVIFLTLLATTATLAEVTEEPEDPCPAPGFFACRSGEGCHYLPWSLCDGMYNDCADGEDEEAAFCKERCQKEGWFTCDNLKCIDPSYRCDGRSGDCTDNSDEIGCFTITGKGLATEPTTSTEPATEPTTKIEPTTSTEPDTEPMTKIEPTTTSEPDTEPTTKIKPTTTSEPDTEPTTKIEPTTTTSTFATIFSGKTQSASTIGDTDSGLGDSYGILTGVVAAVSTVVIVMMGASFIAVALICYTHRSKRNSPGLCGKRVSTSGNSKLADVEVNGAKRTDEFNKLRLVEGGDISQKIYYRALPEKESGAPVHTSDDDDNIY